MIWRKTSPLARQLKQIAEVVREAADAMREQHDSIWRAQDLEFDGHPQQPAAHRAGKGVRADTVDDSAAG